MSFENLNFGLKLSLLLALVVIISIIVSYFTSKELNRKKRVVFAALAAVLLTLFTCFFLMGHSVFFKQENVLTAKVAAFKQYFTKRYKWAGHIFRRDTAFVDSTFIFVDVKNDLALIPDGYASQKTSIAITDRHKLSKVLDFLYANRDSFDLIACDLIFDRKFPEADTALHRSLESFQSSNKILLAYFNRLDERNPIVYLGLDRSYFGDVTKVRDEPIYYSNDIEKDYDGDTVFSFAYQMYTKLNHVDVNKERERYCVFNNNITELNFTDELKYYQPLMINYSRYPKTDDKPNFSYAIPNTFKLGALTTADGQDMLLQKLREKRKSRKIIMIGNVLDDYQDRHQTTAGTLCGMTLLINEFFDYDNGTHKITIAQLLSFILLLFLSFYGILILMLRRAAEEDARFRIDSRVASENRHGILHDTWRWIKTISMFVIDESFYLWLFCIALCLDLLFNKLINITGLIYIMPLFGALLKFFIAKRNREMLGRRLQEDGRSQSRNTDQ